MTIILFIQNNFDLEEFENFCLINFLNFLNYRIIGELTIQSRLTMVSMTLFLYFKLHFILLILQIMEKYISIRAQVLNGCM